MEGSDKGKLPLDTRFPYPYCYLHGPVDCPQDCKGITDPIQNLAQATEQVAAGDLDIKVSIEREDEIGLLVSSFNDMVKKLKRSKESLQSAYLYMKEYP